MDAAGLLAAAAVRLNEAEAAAHSGPPVWVFGVFAFAILVLLLIITMMINVDR